VTTVTRSTRIDRRTALKGMGTALALPMLEAMAPAAAVAKAAGGKLPLRLAFVYVPNGVHMQDWTPKATGASYEITPTLKALEAFRGDLTVLSGLTLDKARANGDGGGDHARAMSAFLTGSQPRKTDGANIRVGISADQVAATKVGHLTRFPSVELGIDRGAQAGNCDSGYSCAYSSNLSWRGESTPNAKEVDPKAVFERLFAGGDGKSDEAAKRREFYRTSVLDFVRDDASRLRGRLGGNDRRKLDEYLDAVREIEQRIERASKPAPQLQGLTLPAKPKGAPADYAEHVRLMCDMMVLAFRADLTRIATFPFANDGSNRPYPTAGVSEGHHDLSHHGNDPAKHAKLAKINRFHLEQFAYLLGQLKGIKEGSGTLLDQCLVVYGSGISDGNAHNHDELPILLAGKGGGSVKPGRHLRFVKETPLMNLYLSLLERVGAPTERLGDSTGRLKGLEG
jgi:hypothetical protein